MDINQKKQVVAQLKEEFVASMTVVVVHYKGLNVAQMTALRKNLRELGAGLEVTKNSLTKLALQGTKFEQLTNLFKGPTAVAYSKDPVSAAKIVVNFAKENEKLTILGGAVDSQVIDTKGIGELAKLPSLDELRARIVGMIQTPAKRIATLSQAPAGQLARVIKAYSQK